ncbi:DUF6233 domain-containing protein [Streptomyces genisteinicus]|uniref:Uncharacterized protein n=1 Tax=Streptomyces genisteinicus TaxID=2768068 RepID=A0A7H0I2U3_9ACTN|nr:DUF6233 domain-containing protein [Streptomyces genisteinicus]QNP67109.1 hypothetical protein IAG43_32260 [Streptomyces genisteinicus]
MSDLPPDLPRLRTLETWLALALARVRERIADEERRERERRRGERTRPPAAEWLIETGIGEGHRALYVHTGGCHMAGKRVRGVSRDAAARAVAEGVEACSHCRADTGLGIHG